MEKLVELWPIGLGFVAFVVWLTRLESKVILLKTEKEALAIVVKSIESGHDELKNKVYDQLASIKESLIKLETSLHFIKKE